MERNERLKAADKCALKYTDENEARIARAAFMLGCEFEAQGEVVKGVILETEEEHWKPSEEQMICPKCGEKMILDEGKVYTSIPPKYGYKCPKCGNYEYSTKKL